MSSHYYIGVDGGATKVVVRLEDASGHLLGRLVGPPANIRLSVDKAWDAVNEVLAELLQSCGLSLTQREHQYHVGMGLAGCEVAKSYEAFLRHEHHFQTLVLSSDSHAACLGAHEGQDGAIIIAGTGVVGYQQSLDVDTKVGGFGFPHDDEGSGAWMGLQAVRLTVKSLDGRHKPSILTQQVYAHFDQNKEALVSWANQADSTRFATLAPIVIAASTTNDEDAIAILQRAAFALDEIGVALLAAQTGRSPLPCALIGGVAPFIEPYLGESLRSRLCEAKATPDKGAIMLVREYLANARGLV